MTPTPTARFLAISVLAVSAFWSAGMTRGPDAQIDRLREFSDAGPESETGTEGRTSGVPTPQDLASKLPAQLADDPQVRAAYAESVRGYYAYQSEAFEHRADVFAWQLWSSRIIFWIVMGLVGVGVLFAWLQFRLVHTTATGDRAAPSDSGQDQDAKQRAEPTPVGGSVKLTKAGLEVSSPVLGVIILAISLAFFFLFLIYVYPIEESF